MATTAALAQALMGKAAPKTILTPKTAAPSSTGNAYLDSLAQQQASAAGPNGPGDTPWWTDAQAQGTPTGPYGNNNVNPGGAGADYSQVENLPTFDLGFDSPSNNATLKSIGYNGDPSDTAALQKFLQDKGLTSKTSFKNSGAQTSAFFDQNGNMVGDPRTYGSDVNSDAFLGGILGATGFGAYAALGAGAGLAGAQTLEGGATPASALTGGSGGLAGTGLPEYSAYAGAGSGASAPLAGDATGTGIFGSGAAADGAGGVGLAEGATPASLAGEAGATGSGLAADGAGGMGLAEGVYPTSVASGQGIAGLAGLSGTQLASGAGSLAGEGASGLGSFLKNTFLNSNGQGLNGLGQGLVGLGAGALTGSLGGGDTSQLNSVDYQKAATAQGQSARTDQVNSQGQMQYKQTGTDAQGNPTYTQVSSLNAPYQANLDKAVGNQGTALSNLSSYNNGLPAAYAGVPGLYGDAGSQAGLVKQAQDAAYNQQTSYLDPQYAQLQKQLQAQLANQGVTYGSDAYNAANTQFGSQQNQAYGTARDSAIAQGDTYANTLFNQNLAAHQQGMADINNQGTNYANQSSGALSGVVQNPTFAATPPATNYLGAAQLQGGANLNQYNAKIGNTNNLTNGLTGIGTSLAGNSSFWSGLGGLFSGG